MTCPQCAFENPPAMAFCGRCGTRLASLCPSCGFANPEGFAFCGKCGARVAEASAPPRQSSARLRLTAVVHSQAPRREDPDLQGRAGGRAQAGHGAVRRLKGSMELLADRDPEEARKLLDPVLERMMEAVHRYEGTVNQVMGDGIMALFGAPLAHEDHAVRACYAALRMQERSAGTPKRSAAHGRDAADPRRAELGRGGRAGDRQRPPHGLHGCRADDPPRGAHGATRRPGLDPHDRRRPCALAEGYVEVEAARAGAVKGLADARRGVRARRGRAGAHAAPGRRRARAHPLRRPRRRARAAAPGARAGRRRPRPGRRGRRRARRREVAPRLGVHPLAPHPGLARPREPARCPTARPPPTCPSSTCSRRTSRSRPRRRTRRSARRSPASS